MIWIDYLIIGIILISSLASLMRGLIKEVLSFIAWIVAFWVALRFSHQVVQWFPSSFSIPPSIQLAITFFLLLLSTLVLAAITNSFLGKLVETVGLTGVDNVLGAFFGFFRGVAIVTILVLFAGMTPIPQDPWWQSSKLIGYFQDLAIWTQSFIPPDIAEHIRF